MSDNNSGKREENTADSPPHDDPRGVNPGGEGPAQPTEIDRPAPPNPDRNRPGQPGDLSKDQEGGGI